MNTIFQKKILSLIGVQDNHPLLVFDKAVIMNRVKILKTNKPENVKIIFPVKSFPDPHVLSLLSSEIDGFEISNLVEFNLISNSVKENKFFFLTNCYDMKVFSTIKNLIVNISSLEQLEELTIANFESISLRLQPPEILEQGRDSRFGVNSKEIATLKANSEFISKVKYLHFHLGFEKTTLEHIKLSVDKLVELQKSDFPHVHTINIGGGLTKLSADDISELYQFLSSINMKFILEPGRFLFEEAGYAVGQVLSVKERKNKLIIEVNLSKECHIKWSYPKTFKIINLNSNSKKYFDRTLCIVGPTCYEGDLLLESMQREDAELMAGSFIILNNISGYSVAWNHEFNGIPMAKVIII